jgi:DNA-binding response OmpR family regulator
MNAPTSIHCIGDYRRMEAENAQLRERIEQLEYEVEHWKREACQLIEEDLCDAIQARFDLSATEAMICTALYQRREKLMSSLRLEGMLDEERGCSLESNIVSVMICKIRAKLGEDAIETVRGRGYRLSLGALEIFDRKLKGTA